MSPARPPAATSSATRAASARASASRHGWLRPGTRSPQSAFESVRSSSTAWLALRAGGRGLAARRSSATGRPHSRSNVSRTTREHVRARAEARGQRADTRAAGLERGAAAAEVADVGVAEAVDRLELVADGEDVVPAERGR